MEYKINSIQSIFDYSQRLIGHSLREVVGEEKLKASRLQGQGKGGLEQMIEELFFEYPINSDPGPDFKEAGLELKGTGLYKQKSGELQIKERLVCDMIDYCAVVEEDFDNSLFYLKCRIMLLIFYLYEKGVNKWDLRYIYTVLWQIPQKDLIIIKRDFNIIVNKIKAGEAHLLSEGDTEYLAACRKGSKGDKLRKQPFSDILAPKRAFSLKTTYMRTVLDYVKETGNTAVSNIELPSLRDGLFTANELEKNDIEDLILGRLRKWYGKSISEIMAYYNPKANTEDYAINYRAASAIISDGIYGCGKDGFGVIEKAEEFEKSGLRLKTIPMYKSGKLKEHMSYENIDYEEIYSNDNWFDSTTYDLFTSRFLFVVFQHPTIDSGSFKDDKKSQILKCAFFWTMPQKDIDIAEEYWEDIRKQVLANKICLDNFWSSEWSEKNDKNFHVRPKGTRERYKLAADNPNGGKADKYCYWFNKKYVEKIIKENETK